MTQAAKKMMFANEAGTCNIRIIKKIKIYEHLYKEQRYKTPQKIKYTSDL